MMNDDIDLLEIEQKIEDRIRAEYMADYKRFQEQRNEFFERTQKWEEGMMIVKAMMPSSGDPLKDLSLDDDEFQEKLLDLIKMASDFQILLDAVNENDLVKAQWDKMMMTLRLTEK